MKKIFYDPFWKKIMLLISISILSVGCSQTPEERVEESIVEPMIVYKGIIYKSGYDESNLIEKLPKNFKEVEQVKDVEIDDSKIPRDGYASAQANQVWGVEKGSAIYASDRVTGYIMTEEKGKYVVYSSKSEEEVDYSDFLKNTNVQSQEKSISLDNRKKILTESVSRKEMEQYKASEGQVLFHNDGKELKNDFFESDQQGNGMLIAVSVEDINGILCETLYFSGEEIEKDELSSYLDRAEDELLEVDQVTVQKNDIIQRFYWEFGEEQEVQGSLSTKFVLHKEGNSAFTWIVQAGSNLKRNHGLPIKSLKVRIEGDYGQQEMEDIGRFYADEKNQYDIGAYKEEMGFSVEEQGDYLNQCGEWTFIRGLQAEENLSICPAMKISHVDRALELNIQYEITVSKGSFGFLSKESKWNTGRIKIVIPS